MTSSSSSPEERPVPIDIAFEGSILPAPPGVCPKCGVEHDVDEPHNRDSLFYQYAFYHDNKRWPSWLDAMGHCSPEVQVAWLAKLEELGVDVGGPGDDM